MTTGITKLYLANISGDIQLHAGLLGCFTEEQRAKLSRFSASRQKTYVFGRRLLLDVIQKRYPNRAKSWEVVDRAGLPPLIKHPSTSAAISFNISHSGDWLGIAIRFAWPDQSAQLGIDIETVKPARGIKTAAYFCNQQQLDEIADLKNRHQQQRQITRLWTQKEAYFKSIEKAIINPQLKALSIIDSKLAESLGYLSSATLDDATEISIFSKQKTNLEISSLTLDPQGEFVPALPLNLHWHDCGVQIAKS